MFEVQVTVTSAHRVGFFRHCLFCTLPECFRASLSRRLSSLFCALYLSASEHLCCGGFRHTVLCTLPECFRASCATMTTEPLHHLTEQSAGVGTWMVKVAMEPCDLTYSWTKNNKTNNGRKLEFVFGIRRRDEVLPRPLPETRQRA